MKKTKRQCLKKSKKKKKRQKLRLQKKMTGGFDKSSKEVEEKDGEGGRVEKIEKNKVGCCMFNITVNEMKHGCYQKKTVTPMFRKTVRVEELWKDKKERLKEGGKKKGRIVPGEERVLSSKT